MDIGLVGFFDFGYALLSVNDNDSNLYENRKYITIILRLPVKEKYMCILLYSISKTAS